MHCIHSQIYYFQICLHYQLIFFTDFVGCRCTYGLVIRSHHITPRKDRRSIYDKLTFCALWVTTGCRYYQWVGAKVPWLHWGERCRSDIPSESGSYCGVSGCCVFPLKTWLLVGWELVTAFRCGSKHDDGVDAAAADLLLWRLPLITSGSPM